MGQHRRCDGIGSVAALAVGVRLRRTLQRGPPLFNPRSTLLPLIFANIFVVCRASHGSGEAPGMKNMLWKHTCILVVLVALRKNTFEKVVAFIPGSDSPTHA